MSLEDELYEDEEYGEDPESYGEEVYDPDIFETAAEGEEEDGGAGPLEEGLYPTMADDVLRGPSGGFGGGIGNVLSPGLPSYLRNSLMSLDAYQQKEKQSDEQSEIAALEEDLANTELMNKLELEKTLGEGKAKITKWHIMIISGVITTLIAIVTLVWRRVK